MCLSVNLSVYLSISTSFHPSIGPWVHVLAHHTVIKDLQLSGWDSNKEITIIESAEAEAAKTALKPTASTTLGVSHLGWFLEICNF